MLRFCIPLRFLFLHKKKVTFFLLDKAPRKAKSDYNNGVKKVLIFDLDGTLLDTITDIRAAINDSLESIGLPYRYSKSECRSLVGDGAEALIHRALQENDNPDYFRRLKSEYMPRYKEYQGRHTKPFNGIVPTLKYLKNKGLILCVCTNKPDELAHIILTKFFGQDFFDAIYGIKEGEKPKPDPHNVLAMMSRFASTPTDTLFIGDSLPDLLTANNAHLPLGLCTWGYGFYKPSLLKEATYVFNKPKDLAKLGIIL